MNPFVSNRSFHQASNAVLPEVAVGKWSETCRSLHYNIRNPFDFCYLFLCRFVPEGTAVTLPIYTLHRDPRYFSPRPEEFWPDRWLTSEEGNVILRKDAFIPFSSGPSNCVGKPLAMVEMRYVLALLIRRFELSLDDGYDPSRWEKGLLDHYVLTKGSLPVKFTVRKD